MLYVTIAFAVGFTFSLIVGKNIHQQNKPDYKHFFKLKYDELEKTIKRNADKEDICRERISKLRREFAKKLDKDFLNDSIGQLQALLHNKKTENSIHKF